MLRYIAQGLCSFQPYLPQIYVESDMDATNCYLFFQRLAAKVDLINTVVAQMHNLPEALNGPVSDVLVGVCEVRSSPHRPVYCAKHVHVIDARPPFRPIHPLPALRGHHALL